MLVFSCVFMMLRSPFLPPGSDMQDAGGDITLVSETKNQHAKHQELEPSDSEVHSTCTPVLSDSAHTMPDLNWRKKYIHHRWLDVHGVYAKCVGFFLNMCTFILL